MPRCLLALLLAALLQGGCTPRGLGHDEMTGPVGTPTTTPDRLRIGVLRTVTPPHWSHGQGIDEQIARALSEPLAQRVEWLTYERADSLLEAMRQDEVDVGVGLLWPHGTRLPAGLNGFSYDTGDLVRICQRRPVDRSIRSGTSTGVALELGGFPDLSQRPPSRTRRADVSSSTPNELLRQIATGDPGCGLAPARIAELWARYTPASFDATPLDMGYSRHAVYRVTRPELGKRLAGVFASGRVGRLRSELRHTQFGFLDDLPGAHYEAFHEEVDERLPRFEPVFRAAAASHRLDWRLLAAMSYQESHWRPHARSPTGVRGMMMLTRPTAREVGVRDRLDPHESIWGGARYLRRLIDELPAEITGSNRIWLSLAAYNMGMHGLSRAQRVARQRGLDPRRWSDLSGLLRNSGDAKWREAAIYVERIRDFEDIIRFRHRHTSPLQARGPAPEDTRS